MQLTKQRSPHYEINNEMFSGITHGIGLGAAIVGTIALGFKAGGDPLRLITFLGFGIGLIILYTASTAFHGFYFTKARHVLQVLDHSGVFILIAASYLPYCLVAIGGARGWWLLGTIWTLCLAGILYECFFVGRFRLLEVAIYIVLGWLCITAMQPLWFHLGSIGFWLLVGGGVAYTLGAVLYAQKQIPYIHVIWHLFVMAGSLLMYLSIYNFV
ncbi:PAQR family membrane homeostasis protein TrhA [Lacticaseibacillus nasuensis]|jgi:hemolysin III|uniref:PAQR family membrane homeostasis protein TrhA n=1 Tax=Lacticaseibacillus nasuensis TaxID=944671 RepID=UPI00396A1DDF